MATQRTSGRAHKAVDYSVKAQEGGSVGPAWMRELTGARPAKENARPASTGGASTKAAGGGKPARKSAPAVASKGRDAGLERLPIKDAKPAAKSAGALPRSDAPPAAAGKQVLPGVFVKGAAPAAPKPGSGGKSGAAAAAKPGSGGKPGAAAAAAKTAAGGGSGKLGAAAAGQAKPAAKSASSGSKGGASGSANAAGGSGSKRKAAMHPEDAGRSAPKPAANSAPAVADAKRHKAAPAAPQAPPQPQRAAPAVAPAKPAAARPAATKPAVGPGVAPAAAAVTEVPALAFEPPPGCSAEELAEHFSTNFRDLHAEYTKLQGLYEDLKAAKIDEEVQQLLEQQNRHVTEHGQKAAALAEHYKAEMEHQQALAAELGGEALLDKCQQLQADVLMYQQAQLDQEVASLEKDKELAALRARVDFLERYARVYEACDKCIQTDDLPRGVSAGAQHPSIQSSGVEMLQAHALVPEGAGGGSIYKRPKGVAAVPDPSYTLPARTPLPPGLAAPAPEAAVAPAQAAFGSAVAPVSGSDMDLVTGTNSAPGLQVPEQQQPAEQAAEAVAAAEQRDQAVQADIVELHPPAQQPQRRQSLQPAPLQEQQQQAQQQAQQRRQSLQPVAGRMAHAAGAPAPRPASAESQVQLGVAAAAGRQQQQRRQTIAPTGAAAAAAGAAAGGSRRVSAPPAPVDRELRFSSVSTFGGAALALAAVPEEQPLAEGQEAAAAAAAAAGDAQQPQQQQQQQAQPAASQATDVTAGAAPGAAGAACSPLVRVTLTAAAGSPASVPAPPRDKALDKLTGLTATPLKGGIYQYTDARFGFVFQLGPASPNSAELPRADEADSDPELCYRPIALGRAAALLPPYLKEEITFVESQRIPFFHQMMDALAGR